MTSLLQSKVFTNFTHSQIYKPTLQPPLELLLKSIIPDKSEDENINLIKSRKQDPLVVFDHDTMKERRSNENDGIFYHLSHRPGVADERRRDYARPRTLRLKKNFQNI